MKLHFNRDFILNLEESLKCEYLVTNGRGGYASSTILDCHKRKYHGLLILPVPGHSKRFNLLSKLDVSVVLKKNEYQLATNKFPNVYHPTGHQYVEKYEQEYFPVTTYRIGDTVITKSILMPFLQDTVLVRYQVVKTPAAVVLKALPFFAFRDIDSLMHQNIFIRPRTFFEKHGFKFDPYEGLPAVYLQTSRMSVFYPAPHWWTNFEYLKERNRGYEYQEDLFSPGTFEASLKEGDTLIFRASLEPAKGRIWKEWDQEEERLAGEKRRFIKDKEPLRTLKVSAGHYVVSSGGDRRDIIAGYHWFGSWGRDTMISLAGLTLCTKREKAALKILKDYAGREKNGLLPNIVAPDGNHAYNCVDTSLLYFRAVQQYLEFTGDREGVAGRVGQTLVKILQSFLEQQVPWTGLGEDGLVYTGSPDTNLTWMDARVAGRPVTPRYGAVVEINALWYNAVMFMLAEWAGQLPADTTVALKQKAELFREHFPKAFWNEADQCLYDVYRSPDDCDRAIRPNQLFALGLPFTCVPPDRAAVILETVKRHLVTPVGLRTLSPRNPDYQVTYTGSQEARDAAYHQGMVWPWLVGIYADALLAHQNPKRKAKEHLLTTFAPLWGEHLSREGLLHISEIFTPDPPYQPKGCLAQAWSMAEVIRTLDNLEGIK